MLAHPPVIRIKVVYHLYHHITLKYLNHVTILYLAIVCRSQFSLSVILPGFPFVLYIVGIFDRYPPYPHYHADYSSIISFMPYASFSRFPV